MEKTENTNELKINNIEKFSSDNIRERQGYDLFRNLIEDKESLQDFVDKFEDIYYISVSPFKIEEFKDYPIIYNILKKYEHTAEYRPLEIMFFKFKSVSEEQKEAMRRYLKETYWERATLDETEYGYVIWYFGGSQWRNSSAFMDDIKKIYPVKTLVK